MRFIYFVISGTFLILFFIAFYNFRRKRIGVQAFIIWSMAFLLLSIVSLFPDLIDLFIGIIGMKFRINFLVFMLCILTPSFIFFQLNNNSKSERDLCLFAQIISVQQFLITGLKSDGHHPKKTSNVLVKMAAYNEEKNIKNVLDQISKEFDVLVVDDCSSDQTAKVASECGAMVVRHEKNMGQGIGDLTGFRVAIDLDYEYIVEMDADGQHNPAEISKFIKKLEDDPTLDIVVGSRILGRQEGHINILRGTFLPFYTRLICWASGYNLTDALCGFKVYRAASLKRVIHVLERPLETEYIAAELYIRFGRAGLKAGEIAVNIRARKYGKSHKGTLRYGFAVAWIILRALVANR